MSFSSLQYLLQNMFSGTPKSTILHEIMKTAVQRSDFYKGHTFLKVEFLEWKGSMMLMGSLIFFAMKEQYLIIRWKYTWSLRNRY